MDFWGRFLRFCQLRKSNIQASDWKVQDLNADPKLPYGDGELLGNLKVFLIFHLNLVVGFFSDAMWWRCFFFWGWTNLRKSAMV